MGKLIKYDLKSMLRSFAPLWIAFLAVAIINRLTMSIPTGLENMSVSLYTIISGLMMMLYVIMILGINTIGLVLVVQRFYNGLLKDEGYLMFTLPVAVWKHISSKGITAAAIILANALISFLTVFILAAGDELFAGIRMGLDWMAENGINSGLLITLVCILVIANIIKSVCHIYVSMALGHLAAKHRVGWSIGSFIAISMLISMLGSIIILIASRLAGGTWIMSVFEGLSENVKSDGYLLAWFGVAMVATLVQMATFYVVTERIMSNKLNLE
jgi:hypothetical protein